MYLAPFSEQDYQQLIDWIPDEEFNLLWGGTLYDWPITIEQIKQRQLRTQVTGFMVVADGSNIGFLELVKLSPAKCRLCQVLVARESHRGLGYGKSMLKLALDYAKRHFNAKQISLAVFEHNQAAVHCYHALGFEIVRRDTQGRNFNKQWWPLLEMELKL